MGDGGGVLNTCREDESKGGCTSVRPLNNNQSISYLCPALEREREWAAERERERKRNKRMSGWVKALLDQGQEKAFTL